MSEPIRLLDRARLAVDGLEIRSTDGRTLIVEDISFSVAAGEVCGLVGESGSGKTSIALSLLGHARKGLKITSGKVIVDGTDLLATSASTVREFRGERVAYVPQDPGSALNPSLRVGTQLKEVLQAHPDSWSRVTSVDARIEEMLREVDLADIPNVVRAYPHQLSGGQQQRVAIAMAFACSPALIVLDEPTTGLDVTTQRHVLDTLRRLCAESGAAAVYVSHDLAVVAELAQSVVVLYAGRIVESGSTATIFGQAAHPYTRGLLRAIPSLDKSERLHGIGGIPPRPDRRPPGCDFAPRCAFAKSPECDEPVPLTLAGSADHSVRCIRLGQPMTYPALREPTAAEEASRDRLAPVPLLQVQGLEARYGSKRVLNAVDFEVRANECVAIVGESGSGKTTLARCISGFGTSWSGAVQFDGRELKPGVRQRTLDDLRTIQYVFQNPYASLNPRRTIGQIVEQPLAHFFSSLNRSEREERVVQTLSDVSLAPHMRGLFPSQLSGGERQRVAIARALVVQPSLLVCDEVTSALDVSVQATTIELLRKLQSELHLAMVFITHNLAIVRSIAQSVVVLAGGEVVEAGSVEQVLGSPRHPYTIRLMSDAPKLSDAERLQPLGPTGS